MFKTIYFISLISFFLFVSPTLACTADGQNLDGSCCSALGSSQMNDTQTDILVCIYEDEAHASMAWKGYTEQNITSGLIGMFFTDCPKG